MVHPVNYVDRGSQTEIQGLAKDPATLPRALKSSPAATAPADTPTPPDDMALDNLSHFTQRPASTSNATSTANLQPSMFLKRKQRPLMVARISLPADDLANDDDPQSPPPTEALMSPLPAANRLHAGHTPIIPRALSPLPHSSGPSSPPGDEGLTGPLTLPPQPGDGTEDTIPLHVLDQELEKLRLEQERGAGRSDSATEAETDHEDDAVPLSRRVSKEGQRHGGEEVEVVDGVLLKKPRMNLGAPLGQA